ncbi:MAG: hypothetical protein K5931_07105 [Lachnospiraceae bacterium]|nr:hypothetical protein [Lachnospiraceae bacterium]
MKYKLNAAVLSAIVVGLILLGGIRIFLNKPIDLAEDPIAISLVIFILSVISVCFGSIAGIVIPIGGLIITASGGLTLECLQNMTYMVIFGFLVGRYAERLAIRDDRISFRKLFTYYMLVLIGVTTLFVLFKPLTDILLTGKEIYNNIKAGVVVSLITMIFSITLGSITLTLISYTSNKIRKYGEI